MEEDREHPEDLESLLLTAVGAGGPETADPLRLQGTPPPPRGRAAGRVGRLAGCHGRVRARRPDRVHQHPRRGAVRLRPRRAPGRPVQVLWPSACATATRATWSSTSPRITRCGSRPARTECADGTEFVGEMSWGIVETEAGPLMLAIGRHMTAHREALARVKRQSAQVAAVAALGERALAGADVADLAAEAVEKLRETLPQTGAFVVHETVTFAAWGPVAGGAALRFEIRTGDEVCGEVGVVPSQPLNEDQENFLRGIANVLATAMGRLR